MLGEHRVERGKTSLRVQLGRPSHAGIRALGGVEIPALPLLADAPQFGPDSVFQPVDRWF